MLDNRNIYDIQGLIYVMNGYSEKEKSLNLEECESSVKELVEGNNLMIFSDKEMYSNFMIGYWMKIAEHNEPLINIDDMINLSRWVGFQWAECKGSLDKIDLRLDGYC